MSISLVTISYNQGEYLPWLFDSLQGQLGPEVEHIVVDPGSTDGSRELIAQWARQDQRIKMIFEKDRGPADGLNRGFAEATGEILAYINADDCLLPSALSYVRKYFESHPDIDVLIGGIKIVDGFGKMGWRGRVADKPTYSRLTAGLWQYYQQGTFFRRAIFQRTDGFNIQNRTCWDRELIADMAICGAKFSATSRPLGVFRTHPESITGSGGQAGAAYFEDYTRIDKKIHRTFGCRGHSLLSRWLRLEARVNPWRWLKQFRPCWF